LRQSSSSRKRINRPATARVTEIDGQFKEAPVKSLAGRTIAVLFQRFMQPHPQASKETAMTHHKLAAVAALLLLHPLLWADASFQSSTQITGGSLANSITSSPLAQMAPGAKSVLDPTTEITIVHGNQKAVISKDHTELYDIDKETLIRIDNTRKTYTLTTFAQMRQLLKEMPQKMAQMQSGPRQAPTQNNTAANFKTTFDTQVKNPGISKVVNGLNAQEWIITQTTKVTNPNTPNNPAITYVTTTEVWIAPDPPEVLEIQNFDVRMYTKMSEGVDMQALNEQMKTAGANGGMGMMFAHQPGASDAMAEMSKEIAKIKGFRVLEVTSMSSAGMLAVTSTPGAPAAAPPPAAPAGGSVAGQVATDTATQTAAGESGKMGVFGSALANSALGAFRRKKSTPPAAAPTPVPASAPAAAIDVAGTSPATASNVLMTTIRQKTNFSHEPAPASAFLIPAGYKQVQSPNGMF
jgi:hypothetical protein